MNIKTFLLLCFSVTFFISAGYGQQKDKISKVTIDAGHGGSDPGCVGKKAQEKEVNLIVALKLGKLISENFKDVTVIYTRKTDVAVELYKRAQIANNQHSDLFISIHCNAAKNKEAHGIETFVMGLHKTEEQRAVAKKENGAMLLEKNYEQNYEGFQPNSPEADIIISLYTSAYLKNSATFAKKVQNNLVHNTHLLDRDVRQAGLWVLYKVAMPSVLVELGFLSNPKEEEYLTQASNQEVMAISLYNAFVEYKNFIEGTNKPKMPLPAGKPDKPASTAKPAEEPAQKPVERSAQNPVAKEEGVVFKVQFYISSTKMPVNHKKFSDISDVDVYYENNLWKYTSGAETEYEKATQRLTEVKNKFSDAFIIAYSNGEKIPLSEALRLIKK